MMAVPSMSGIFTMISQLGMSIAFGNLTLCLPRSPMCTSAKMPRSPICSYTHAYCSFILLNEAIPIVSVRTVRMRYLYGFVVMDTIYR